MYYTEFGILFTFEINENYAKIYRTLRLLSCRKGADRSIAYLSLI